MTGRRINRRSLLLAGLTGAATAAAPTVSAGDETATGTFTPSAPAIGRNLPDVVVVGAGAFGGWTALELRERGARVTMVDVYGPGNPRASSGDESRLIRASYGDREIYTRWATEAFDLWQARQEEFGRRVIYPNGSLRVMKPPELAAQRPIFDRLKLAYELLTPEEVHRRWPQIRYDDAETIVYEPGGGVLKARESMIAVAEAIVRKGGHIRVGHALPGFGSGGMLNNVLIDGEPLNAGAFVFATGPWLPQTLPTVLGDRIRTPRREVFYIGSPRNDRRYRWEHLPNLSDLSTYTASDIDYGIKVAARLADTPIDPDDTERLPSPFLAQQVLDYVALRMPGLVGQPIVATRVCQTENSDNGHYIIDSHPDYSNVWIAGGGSGHAFKMGPVLGRYVADRVVGEPQSAEISAIFSLSSHGAAT